MKPAHILVVEDEDELRDMLATLLRREGLEVEEAANGVEALLKLRSHTPDLMLLDLKMPEMDGYEVLRRVRSDPALRGLTVVILSGHHQPQDLERGLELGADEYLFKPVENWELRARVKSLLRQNALRARVAALEGSQAAGTLREIERFLESELRTASAGRRADLEALAARTRGLVELFEKNLPS